MFGANVIPLGLAAADSDLEVTWQAIDTAYPSLRSAFQALESEFGPYTLKKEYPSDTSSTTLPPRMFELELSNYVPYDSITTALDSIAGIFANFSFPTFPSVVENNIERLQNGWAIIPNPASTIISVLGSFEPSEFELIDDRGREVQRIEIGSYEQGLRIDISNLAVGEYWVRGKNFSIPFTHIK